MSPPDVLVVEDDLALRDALEDTLSLAGYGVAAATEGSEALEQMAEAAPRVVVSDIQMRPMDGMTFLREVKRLHPGVPVLLMTAYATIQQAVEAMQEGATDYLVKPFEAEVLVTKVAAYMPPEPVADDEVVAVDPASRELMTLAARVAESDATVLVTGDSGSGKEVLARFIHTRSARARGPFVAINCAAIPDNMLEAVLFGYEKGAYTGAYRSSPGKFEQAEAGTLLLDEISEMDLGLQAKLLRVLQEREVERLGGSRTIPLDVRVVATSNRDMKAEVAAGRFREDLYYRLNVFPLHLRPLNERPGDIVPLAEHLVAQRAQGGALPTLSPEARERLLSHPWPGNVRELDNVVQRALILRQGGVIGAGDLLFEGSPPAPPETPAAPAPAPAPQEADDGHLGGDLKRRERELIVDALRRSGGSRKEAAELLGISPRTLRHKLQRLREAGVSIPEDL